MKKNGFTLIELLIVLVILSVLAAIAIPAYTGYLAKAKEKTVTENWDVAARLIKAEIAKRNISLGSVTTDVVANLNQGNKKSPYNTALDAFISGSSVGAGQVAIKNSAGSDGDIKNASNGDTITIIADNNGNATADLSITIDVE